MANGNKDIAIVSNEEKVVERDNEDNKMIVDILKVINPGLSEQNAIAHRRLGLFKKGEKSPFKMTFMNKQMVTALIRKAKILATHEEYKKTGEEKK